MIVMLSDNQSVLSLARDEIQFLMIYDIVKFDYWCQRRDDKKIARHKRIALLEVF